MMKKIFINRTTRSSCDWRSMPERPKQNRNRTRLYKYEGDFSWTGIKTEKYKHGKGDWSGILRRTLIGNHGESAKFHLRYFEIAQGGCSSFEMHKHEHVVIGVTGKGVCIAGNEKHQIGFLDTLYIAPDTPHQLGNPFREPFGFFCIVNSKRDKPRIIKKEIRNTNPDYS
jgi:quercetin dioxygenase-like cupin family protein